MQFGLHADRHAALENCPPTSIEKCPGMCHFSENMPPGADTPHIYRRATISGGEVDLDLDPNQIASRTAQGLRYGHTHLPDSKTR